MRRHYHANVALIDDQIGLLLDAARTRFGENLLVAFTCDHGEMLGNHGIWGKGNCFYSDVVHIPFLLSRPYRAGAGSRSQRLTSHVDLYPTLVAAAQPPGATGASEATGAAGATGYRVAAGVDPVTRCPVDGRHLDGDGHDYVYAEGEGFLTVTDGRYTLASIDKAGRTFTEFFDLEADPYQLRNLDGHADYAAAQRDLAAAAVRGLLPAALP